MFLFVVCVHVLCRHKCIIAGKPVSWIMIAPSITPIKTTVGSNNPAMRLYKFDTDTGQVSRCDTSASIIIILCARARARVRIKYTKQNTIEWARTYGEREGISSTQILLLLDFLFLIHFAYTDIVVVFRLYSNRETHGEREREKGSWAEIEN